MDKIYFLSNAKKGVMNQYSAISQANKSNLTIISNKDFERYLLVEDSIFKDSKNVPIWTGTYIIFEEPNKKIGQQIIYIDYYTKKRYIFEPKIYVQDAIGQKDIAFVINHGFSNFDSKKACFELIQDGKDYIIKINDTSALKIVNIPSSSDWYLIDKELGLPTMKTAYSKSPNACYFFRDNKYCGLLSRTNVNPHIIYAFFRPSVLFRVLVKKDFSNSVNL